jgi:mRNA-degrading endonuclease toxin of MazEF toxin-antitoxin module
VRQYDIWWANLPAPAGKRPVLLLSRDSAYQYLDKFIAVEVTTTIRGIAEEVSLGRAEGMSKRCVANCDNIRTVPRSRLMNKAGSLGAPRRLEIKRAIGHALGWQELVELES